MSRQRLKYVRTMSKMSKNEAKHEVDRAVRITNAMLMHVLRHQGCDCCSQILVAAGEIRGPST